MTIAAVVARHPVLLIHLVGMLMVWVALSILGGYDHSIFASVLFFSGQLLSFFRWLVIEIALTAAGGDFVKKAGWLAPSLLALGLAHCADLLLLARRTKR